MSALARPAPARVPAPARALALLCACAALAAAPAPARAAGAGADKRAEMAPVPFVLGSRYGRSPPRLLAPRNDRFFMGSRYGKRSEPYSAEGPAGLGGPPLSTLMGSGEGPRGPPAPPLDCVYTGVLELYRCHRVHPSRVARLPLAFYDNSSAELEPRVSDED